MVASLVRTSDDEYSACDSMGVPPASGIDRHAAYQRNGHVSLNAEAAHCLPAEWTGRRLPEEWTGRRLPGEWKGLNKCRGGTLPASGMGRRRALFSINAEVA